MTAPTQRPIDYAQLFPWTRLFRALRIATDPRKLLLAAVAITLLWGGGRLLGMLPFAPPAAAQKPAPWNDATPVWSSFAAGSASSAPVERVASTDVAAVRLLAPLRPLVDVLGLTFGPPRPWTEIAWLWTRLLGALAIWSVFGGAIARLAAVEFARDERIGLMDAVRFAVMRFPSLFAAPLLPIAAILVLWGLNAGGGLIGRIPVAGSWLVAIAWGLAAAVSLLIVLITIATAVGWPLMVAAVATESSDAFDGFSRAFSFVYSRPWLTAWCLVVSLVLGIVCMSLIDALAWAVATATARTIGTGMGEHAVAVLHEEVPAYFAGTVDRVDSSLPRETPPSGLPTRLTEAWLSAIAAIAIGFATSYFWTATTIVYFLLRRADDATHFDEVWMGEADEDDDLLPLAGIASTGQPVTERSHLPTVDPPATTR